MQKEKKTVKRVISIISVLIILTGGVMIMAATGDKINKVEGKYVIKIKQF